MKPLTAKQQELIEENHNLIYKFASEKKLNIDDYYDILVIGLCIAATIYDEKKGKFSTVAYRCMNNKLNDYWRHKNIQSAIPESMIFSYDTPKDLDESNNNKGCQNAFSNNCSAQDIVITKMMKETLINMLTKREQEVAKLILSDIRQLDIAEMLNCSRQNVAAIVKTIRKKWINYLKSECY